MALALAALGYSINTEDEDEIEEAKQLLIDVKPNVDTINSTFIERATPRRDRLRHGLERRHPARDRRAGEEGPRDGLPRARRPDGVLGRQLGHPGGRRAPGRRAQVDQLRARARGGRPGDELPPVPGAGRRDRGRRPGPRQGPGHQRPGRQDRAATSRRSRRRRASSSATGPTRSSRPPSAMAVADATSARRPAAARGGGRVAGAVAGLAAAGRRRRALHQHRQPRPRPRARRPLLLLADVPVFVLGAAALRHITGADRAEHKEYPFGLSAPVARVLLRVLPRPARLPRAVRGRHARGLRRGTRTASTWATSPTRSTRSTSRCSCARCARRRSARC